MAAIARVLKIQTANEKLARKLGVFGDLPKTGCGDTSRARFIVAAAIRQAKWGE